MGNTSTTPNDSLVAISPPPANLPIANASLSKSQLQFALLLAAKAYHGPTPLENLVFSPLSIALALAMTCLGASGDTRQEMLQQLFSQLVKDNNLTVNSNDGAINDATHKHMHVLACQILNHYSAEFSVANKVIVLNIDVRKEFLDNVKHYYESEVAFDGDKATINAWAEQHTRGKVKDLLKEELPDNCKLVLLNAVYFKSNWEMKFQQANTVSELFTLENKTKKSVKMMHHYNKDLPYVRNEHFEAVELMYQYKQWSLVLLLPNSDKYTTMAEFMNSSLFNSSEEENPLQKMLLGNDHEHGSIAGAFEIDDLAVPRFKIETDKLMNNPLIGIGMSKMFGGGFDNMAPNEPDLRVAKVIHKAMIEVNEEGTEAAAATAVLMCNECMKLPTIVHFNRPFVYLLRHVPSKIVAFMGVVHEPKE